MRLSPTARKIAAMLMRGQYEPPTVYDDLQDGIDYVKSLRRDPWCPADLKDMLVQWQADACRLQLAERHGEGET